MCNAPYRDAPTATSHVIYRMRLQPQHFPEPLVQHLHEVRGDVANYPDHAILAHVPDQVGLGLAVAAGARARGRQHQLAGVDAAQVRG